MKVPLGWLVSWALYWLGHRLYRLYDRLMLASLKVQQWNGGYGPWSGMDDEAN